MLLGPFRDEARATLRIPVLLIVALVMLVHGPAQAADAPTVRIENFSFVPETVTVPVGSTVTWENGDDIPHSIVFADRSFRSKPLDTHDRAIFKPIQRGEIAYFCGLHPHMTGRIIVVP